MMNGCRVDVDNILSQMKTLCISSNRWLINTFFNSCLKLIHSVCSGFANSFCNMYFLDAYALPISNVFNCTAPASPALPA